MQRAHISPMISCQTESSGEKKDFKYHGPGQYVYSKVVSATRKCKNVNPLEPLKKYSNKPKKNHEKLCPLSPVCKPIFQNK